MADPLIARLDRFAIRLLDDAEAGCGDPQSDDTSTGEDSPGKPAVSLTERVAALKAVTAYLSMRDRRGEDEAPERDEDGEPEIVRLERKLRAGNRRR